MAVSPRSWDEALKVAQREATNRSQDWTGYCQKFVRTTYGIPGLFASAWAQWLGADDEDKHPGGDPSDAPIGSALCFRNYPYGHITLSARPFGNGTPGSWGTDMVRRGWPDKHSRIAPVTVWRHEYVGWLSAVNDYDLRLKEKKPPKPKQDKRYRAVDKAIQRLEMARNTARNQKDWQDAKALTEEIRHLRRLYAKLRRY